MPTIVKKLIAILLICLLFFNWYGYRIVTDVLSSLADQQLELQLDNNDYDESALIEVMVPLNVPYQNVQSDFERHYGEIEVDGVFYTYVKSKVENGNLVLKCIPNDSKQKIRSAGADYFKLTNGLGHDQQGKKNNATQVVKQSIGDFDDQLNTFAFRSADDVITHRYVPQSYLLYNTPRNTPAQPPEFIVFG